MRRIGVYRYRIGADGGEAAGVLANELPPSYSRRAPNGTLMVDYNSLLAELWGCVRHLSQRTDELEARLSALQNEKGAT